MKIITAQDFYEKWMGFINCKDPEECLFKWQSSKEWTAFMLGNAYASSKASPFGDYISNDDRWREKIRYRTEDGKFDMSISLHENFQPLPTLGRNYIKDVFDIRLADDTLAYYPPIYDVLIEHENDVYSSWNEIAKLSWVRSPLKVLITYHTDKINPEQILLEREMLIDQFDKIVGESTKNFEDNSQTEYLLILGHNDEKKISWTADVLDHCGKHKFEL